MELLPKVSEAESDESNLAAVKTQPGGIALEDIVVSLACLLKSLVQNM